jgi:hypothetical protein
VRQDVQQASERIANIKAPYAPGLVSRTVFGRQTGRDDAAMGFIDIVDFDREIGNRCPRAAFGRDAELRRRLPGAGEGDDPAEVHHDFEAEKLRIKAARHRHLLTRRANIGDDPLHFHADSTASSFHLGR